MNRTLHHPLPRPSLPRPPPPFSRVTAVVGSLSQRRHEQRGISHQSRRPPAIARLPSPTMGFFGSLFCCFPRAGSRNRKSKRSNDQASLCGPHPATVYLPLSWQSNSEENSLLDHTHGASSNPRNQDTADASSITSFGNAEANAGKAYGATGQDEQRQREEDEREREERERERLNAIAGQAGKWVPPFSPQSITNHRAPPAACSPSIVHQAHSQATHTARNPPARHPQHHKHTTQPPCTAPNHPHRHHRDTPSSKSTSAWRGRAVPRPGGGNAGARGNRHP